MNNSDKLQELENKMNDIENSIKDLDTKVEEIKKLIISHQRHTASEHGHSYKV